MLNQEMQVEKELPVEKKVPIFRYGLKVCTLFQQITLFNTTVIAR